MSAARDLACFYRTLGELLAAGVLASEALRTAAAFLPASVPAVARVAAGEPISAALARLPGCIPGEHLHFMRLGERSGSLDRVLGDLAEVAEQAESARGRIRGGLVLPGMMIHAAAVVSPLPQGLLRGDWAGYFGFALGLIGLFWAVVLGVRLLATRAAPDRLDRLARASGLARRPGTSSNCGGSPARCGCASAPRSAGRRRSRSRPDSAVHPRGAGRCWPPPKPRSGGASRRRRRSAPPAPGRRSSSPSGRRASAPVRSTPRSRASRSGTPTASSTRWASSRGGCRGSPTASPARWWSRRSSPTGWRRGPGSEAAAAQASRRAQSVASGPAAKPARSMP